MKKFALILAVAFSFAATTQGALTLVDSFTGYADGQSLKDVGGWGNTSNHGGTPWASDPGNIHAKDIGGNMVLALTDDDAQGSGDLLYGSSGAALDIPDITDLGTIYMRIKIADDSSFAITTNGLASGFDPGAGGEQTVSGWSDQASINNFEIGTLTGPTYQFRARDGGAYVTTPHSSYDSGVWYEYWIHLDVGAQSSRYYMRELGNLDLPVAMLDAGGSPDWGFRSTIAGGVHNSITYLKFKVSPGPNWACDTVPGGVDDPAKPNCVAYETLIDSIAVDTEMLSFCTVPEPTSLALIAISSIMVIRRR